MKRIIILILISFSFITVKAQYTGGGGSTTVGKIAGTLIDSVTKQPLSYASVALFRSTGKSPINGVLTDEKGGFKIDGIHPGTYKIRITYVGYPEKFVDGIVTTDSKPDKNMGQIPVAPSAKALNEVSITAAAPLIENKIDKIVYNAEKDLTSVGGNATDVLQKVPLVAVDINGNVSLRGDNNVRVLINGKPSGATSASLSDVLKTIPADQIKSIEVITSPSAKYDAEGSAGIINIITKQKNMTGISGSVSGGIGTRQNNGNINLNYNKNRFSLSMNVGGNYTWPQTSLTTFNNDIQPNDTIHTATSSSGTNYVKRYGVIGNVSANYDFNAFNSLHTNIRLNQGGFNTNANTQSQFTNFLPTPFDKLIGDTSSAYSSKSLGHNSFGGFDWNLDYTHKFKKEGEELDISTQWSHSRTVTDFTNYYYNSKIKNVEDNINGLNNEYTFQVDYTLPISKVLKLEAGGKEILRRLVGTSDAFDYDYNQATPDYQTFTFDNLNSSVYDYNQNVTAAYSVFTITLPKGYSILVGARDEITSIHGQPQSGVDSTLKPFSNDYNTFIPSLTIQKQISSTQTVKLAYSKRITRPSLQFLNPYDNKTNILAQSEGNPTLAPEISQTIEFDYITFIKSSVLNMSVYYKHTGGLIESIATPIVDTASHQPGTLTTYHNIGNNNSFGASFFGSITPFKNVTMRASINAYTYKPDPTGLFIQDKTQDGTYIQYNGFGMVELDLQSGFIAQIFAIENSPRHTIQGTNPSFSLLGAGVRKQFLKKKAAIGINTLEPFNKYKDFNTKLSSPGFTQTSTFQFPFRSVGLTFSYSFGKTTFSNPTPKKGVNNDDLKQDQGGTPGGAGGGTGTGNR